MLESCLTPELVQRDHPAAGAPARRRRRDLLQRHRGAAEARRGRPRHRARAAVRCSAPRSAAPRTSRRCARLQPERSAAGHRRRRPHRGAARRHPADRLRRRAVHPGGLPRRGRAVQGPPARPHPDARRPGGLARADELGRRRDRRLPARPGARRRERRASCSTRGSGRCRSPTTSGTSRRTPRRRWPRSAISAFR